LQCLYVFTFNASPYVNMFMTFGKYVPEEQINFQTIKTTTNTGLWFDCRLFIYTMILAAIPFCVSAQSDSVESFTSFVLAGPTVVLDSNSIVPESFMLEGLSPDQYNVDFAKGVLTITDNALNYPIEIKVRFETFPFNFTTPYQHKDLDLILESDRIYNPFRSQHAVNSSKLVDLGDLEKRGSVSRGITVGNSQNLSVNSSLNLQLSGQLNERFSLVAAITDDNIPIQPEGNTQQLQDFDQVYLQIYDPKNRITAGDFQVAHDRGYFMRFNKKLQGGRYETKFKPLAEDSSKAIYTDVSGAVSRGKFARQIIQGGEGNQGPYRLVGSEGERFIVVLSGTERVYIDGRLLVRGQENDYVVNYNTSEVTFTAKMPITKDRRIVVEFQYSDRNYARSLLYSETGYSSDRLQMNLSLYSEQDSKNQPLQQDLTDVQKDVLRSIGDSLDLAIASSIDTASFNENQLLYLKVDSMYFDPVRNDSFLEKDVLIYTTSSEGPLYKASFSEVGAGNGNYVKGIQLAFGRVYEWVAPIGGVPQGNFEPVVFLVTPKQRQMVAVSAVYDLTENIQATIEWAGSQYDVNTFSSSDKSDDLGMASKINIGGSQPINGKWRAIAGLDYEFVNQDFKEIERFRSVEFDRDWNIRSIKLQDNQSIIGAEIGVAKAKEFKTIYGIKSYNAGTAFRGIQNALTISSQTDRLRSNYAGSLTNQAGNLINAQFYQHNSEVVVPIWKIQLGYKDDFEQNMRYDPKNDTLSKLSYQFWEWEASVASADTAKNHHRISYAERTDWLKDTTTLAKSTFARIYGYQMEWNGMEHSRLVFRVNYRTLDIVNQKLTPLKKENTLISRVEYSFRALKGALSSSTFYEIGSGLENKREFIFIETGPGQGTHIHIDYNNNGQKELDEFEQAIQVDQIASANYIKVFVPTDDYVRAFTNQFTQTLFLRPAAVWRSKSGVRKAISLFSDQFTYSSDRKNLQLPLVDQFNPFLFDLQDSLLMSVNSNLRNIFYFNQSHPVFGADFNYQRLDGRNFLTSGFESRSADKTGVGVRWNFASALGTEVRAEQGNKSNASNAISLNSRNYHIFYQQIEPKLNIQPGSLWRLSLLFNYKEQQNRTESTNPVVGRERSIVRKTGLEFTLSSPEKGSLILSGNLIQINYSGSSDSPVGYEMLDGLQPGLNGTWGISYQRTLANNLQLNFNYNGRQSPGIRIIHTGGVQARAFF
jgi:hypothetical protein